MRPIGADFSGRCHCGARPRVGASVPQERAGVAAPALLTSFVIGRDRGAGGGAFARSAGLATLRLGGRSSRQAGRLPHYSRHLVGTITKQEVDDVAFVRLEPVDLHLPHRFAVVSRCPPAIPSGPIDLRRRPSHRCGSVRRFESSGLRKDSQTLPACAPILLRPRRARPAR